MNSIKETWLKLWNKINKPHGAWLVVFYFAFIVIIASTLTLVFLGYTQNVFSYFMYVIAALSLTYFVYTIVYFAPSMKTAFIHFLKKYKFTNTLLENYGYRTIVFSIITFILNVSYVAFMVVMTVLSRSAWYFSLTIYYIALTMLKGNVFYSKKKYGTALKEARAYRFAGIMFIVMTLAFSGVMVLIYKSDRVFEYSGLLIYVAASFTFYKLTLSIINIFKARKYNDLYIQTIRNVNLASALISIIILQIAMFQEFSPESNSGIANVLTSTGMSAIILTLGILMIIKANKTIKEINETNETKE